jgi:hypothetical protein
MTPSSPATRVAAAGDARRLRADLGTGFIVARYGMPHAPPLKFLSVRYALSLVCFGLWVALARGAGRSRVSSGATWQSRAC